MNMPTRAEQLCAFFPLLLPTVQKLNSAGITYAIGGSACLFVLGNHRTPGDVDIQVPDDMHDAADAAFGITSYWYQSAQEHVRNSNPHGDHALQFTSALTITVEGKQYHLALDENMLTHALVAQVQEEQLRFFPPEDVLLVKALLQRGPEVEKNDVEDIKNFIKIYPQLDRTYLKSRVRLLDATERVKGVLI